MLPLGGVELADAGLDGDAQLREGGENLTEQAVKLVGEGEQTGALALARHRPGGAAEVEVHLAIAACVQLAGAPDEVLAAVCQNLRHDREPLVVRGLDLVALLRLKAVVRVRREEGGEVFVRPAEELVVDAPPEPARQTLHRRGVELFIVHRTVPPDTSPD